MSTQRKISLGNNPGAAVFTAAAAAELYPGHLVELTSAGTVQKHSTAGGSAEKAFAVENEENNTGVTTAYAAASQVKYAVFPSGSIVSGRLLDGEAAVIGSKLESSGAGTLRVVDADASVGDIGVASIVGVALEAVDMSGSAGVDPDPFIKFRIL